MKKMYTKDLTKDLHIRLSSDDLELASRIARRKLGWNIQDAIRYAICSTALNLDVFDAFDTDKDRDNICKNDKVGDCSHCLYFDCPINIKKEV